MTKEDRLIELENYCTQLNMFYSKIKAYAETPATGGMIIDSLVSAIHYVKILEILELKRMFDNNIYFSTKDGKYYTLNFIKNTMSIEYNAGSGSITQDIIIHLYMLDDRLDDKRFKDTLEEVYQDDLRIFFQIRDGIKELLRYIHDHFRGLIANIEFREKAKEAGIEL